MTESILEMLKVLKDKNPKYTHLIVNEQFDKDLRAELFGEKEDVKVWLSDVAGMVYVISPFFREDTIEMSKEETSTDKVIVPKFRLAQFNAHAVIAQHYVMNNDNPDREEEYIDDFFNLLPNKNG